MASRGEPGVTKAIPSLGVSDIHRSVGFYREFFGFEVEDSYHIISAGLYERMTGGHQ